jgi:hypothetical protein
VNRFNWKPLFAASLAGVLVGILTTHPAACMGAGVAVGGALAFFIPTKKKTCCQ